MGRAPPNAPQRERPAKTQTKLTLSYFYLTKKCYNILLAGNNTSFLLGWAPNGKEVCWLAWGWLPSFLGARARSKKRRAINKSPPRRLSGRVGLSFLCGLRAGPPAIAPHKEDKHSPATLPFNKFILSFFFFLARRAWTVLVVGYGWGPALCRREIPLQETSFFSFHSLCLELINKKETSEPPILLVNQIKQSMKFNGVELNFMLFDW